MKFKIITQFNKPDIVVKKSKASSSTENKIKTKKISKKKSIVV